MTVVAFDFDGTLTVRDTVVPFLRRVAGSGTILRASIPVARSSIRGLKPDRDLAKAVLLRKTLADRPSSEVSAAGVEYAHSITTRFLRSDTVRRLRWHQAQGHRVLIVSASLDAYLVHVGALLGVESVLCTRLAVNEASRHTGLIDGSNCRGVEKVTRLTEWANGNGLEGDGWLTWAYGDSSGDREMLAFADTGVHVGRRSLE